ncbi:hypothetical protein PAPYR_3955 [Paratrimastix pyriformis]|uniref:RRM domain-containing protein n=1 Tax=Paratrimastix pyriformis TaxID=342808 RepID=A0ABQ8UL11_9EUKA|nr:hypothetical protein PAPYR_3955 [Paratrimastix pyriformis]
MDLPQSPEIGLGAQTVFPLLPSPSPQLVAMKGLTVSGPRDPILRMAQQEVQEQSQTLPAFSSVTQIANANLFKLIQISWLRCGHDALFHQCSICSADQPKEAHRLERIANHYSIDSFAVWEARVDHYLGWLLRAPVAALSVLPNYRAHWPTTCEAVSVGATFWGMERIRSVCGPLPLGYTALAALPPPMPADLYPGAYSDAYTQSIPPYGSSPSGSPEASPVLGAAASLPAAAPAPATAPAAAAVPAPPPGVKSENGAKPLAESRGPPEAAAPGAPQFLGEPQLPAIVQEQQPTARLPKRFKKKPQLPLGMDPITPPGGRGGGVPPSPASPGTVVSAHSARPSAEAARPDPLPSSASASAAAGAPPASLADKMADRAMRNNPCRIFVGNVAWTLTADDVRTAFERFGPVVECDLRPWTPLHHMGFGFVTFQTREAAVVAIEQMQGVVMGGRPLRTGTTSPLSQPRPSHDHRAAFSPNQAGPRSRPGLLGRQGPGPGAPPLPIPGPAFGAASPGAGPLGRGAGSPGRPAFFPLVAAAPVVGAAGYPFGPYLVPYPGGEWAASAAATGGLAYPFVQPAAVPSPARTGQPVLLPAPGSPIPAPYPAPAPALGSPASPTGPRHGGAHRAVSGSHPSSRPSPLAQTSYQQVAALAEAGRLGARSPTADPSSVASSSPPSQRPTPEGIPERVRSSPPAVVGKPMPASPPRLPPPADALAAPAARPGDGPIPIVIAIPAGSAFSPRVAHGGLVAPPMSPNPSLILSPSPEMAGGTGGGPPQGGHPHVHPHHQHSPSEASTLSASVLSAEGGGGSSDSLLGGPAVAPRSPAYLPPLEAAPSPAPPRGPAAKQ